MEIIWKDKKWPKTVMALASAFIFGLGLLGILTTDMLTVDNFMSYILLITSVAVFILFNTRQVTHVSTMGIRQGNMNPETANKAMLPTPKITPWHEIKEIRMERHASSKKFFAFLSDFLVLKLK